MKNRTFIQLLVERKNEPMQITIEKHHRKILYNLFGVKYRSMHICSCDLKILKNVFASYWTKKFRVSAKIFRNGRITTIPLFWLCFHLPICDRDEWGGRWNKITTRDSCEIFMTLPIFAKYAHFVSLFPISSNYKGSRKEDSGKPAG